MKRSHFTFYAQNRLTQKTYSFYKMTFHTPLHLKRIRLVSLRSSHLPFKMHSAGFRAFKSNRRANRTDLRFISVTLKRKRHAYGDQFK